MRSAVKRGVRIRWCLKPKGAPDAEATWAELERIRDARGRLDPEVLVAESTPSDATLHGAFTWDDRAAAHEHRLSQARFIFRSLRVETIAETAEEPLRVRALFPLQGDYRSTESLLVCDERVALIARAKQEMTAWRRRYAAFVEFAAVFAAVDAIEAD